MYVDSPWRRRTSAALRFAGTSPGGRTNETATPGCAGTTGSVSSSPPGTGLTANAPSDTGAGPSEGPGVRNTNGWGSRPHGMLAATGVRAGAHPLGASASRSMPGSVDATSQIAGASGAPSCSARTCRRSGASVVYAGAR